MGYRLQHERINCPDTECAKGNARYLCEAHWQMVHDHHANMLAAHRVTNWALESKKITRAQQCEKCGGSARIHGHHEDYSKPLDITWLCHRCHMRRHAEIRHEQMAAAERVMAQITA